MKYKLIFEIKLFVLYYYLKKESLGNSVGKMCATERNYLGSNPSGILILKMIFLLSKKYPFIFQFMFANLAYRKYYIITLVNHVVNDGPCNGHAMEKGSAKRTNH